MACMRPSPSGLSGHPTVSLIALYERKRKAPGLTVGGLNHRSFSVYALNRPARFQRVLFLRTANMAAPAAAISTTATAYGSTVTPVFAVVLAPVLEPP